jgi:hypothetical protein
LRLLANFVTWDGTSRMPAVASAVPAASA